MSGYYVAVDVGSEHIAAGVLDATGQIIARSTHAMTACQPGTGLFEQCTSTLWDRCTAGVREAVERAGVAADEVAGLCFETVNALVVLDGDGAPCSLSPTGEAGRNVILDTDQRAAPEADAINQLARDSLAYAGGAVSPEHALPRLLWLKRHCPQAYEQAALFLDLSEFLTCRATGALVRSQSVVATQWLYQPEEGRWPGDVLARLGLEELVFNDSFTAPVRGPNTVVGGLTASAARSLALAVDTPVVVGLPDRCAAALGLLGDEPEGTLAVATGTSACHVAIAPEPVFAPGIGGPARADVPAGYWLNYVDHGAFGALLDYVMRHSAGYPELLRGAQASGRALSDRLVDRVRDLEQREAYPTRTLHVLDYHCGNRSCHDDATRRGMMSGLSMDQDVDALARRYLATIQALCYGTRHSLEAMNEAGHQLEAIRACGQLAANPLWCRELADATGVDVAVPSHDAPLLKGAALATATALGHQPSLRQAMAASEEARAVIHPRPSRAAFHDTKYQVYRQLYADQMAYRELMARV